MRELTDIAAACWLFAGAFFLVGWGVVGFLKAYTEWWLTRDDDESPKAKP